MIEVSLCRLYHDCVYFEVVRTTTFWLLILVAASWWSKNTAGAGLLIASGRVGEEQVPYSNTM